MGAHHQSVHTPASARSRAETKPTRLSRDQADVEEAYTLGLINTETRRKLLEDAARTANGERP